MYDNIKFFVMDVDGTLTDGKIYMGNDGEVIKAFNIKDGCGIHDILIPSGIIPIVITGRKSKMVENRCLELDVNELHQGISDKYAELCNILIRYSADSMTNYDFANVAYIGDDINDLNVMQEIKHYGGIVGCPKDAATEVKNAVDFISEYNGGNGAVRDFIEHIMRGCE